MRPSLRRLAQPLVITLSMLCTSNAFAQFHDLYSKAKQKVNQAVAKTGLPGSNSSGATGKSNYDYCALQFGAHRYYSAIFALPPNRYGTGADPETAREERGRFQGYLLQTFHEHSPRPSGAGACNGGWQTEDEARRAKELDQKHFAEENSLNSKTTETDWKWSEISSAEQQNQLPVPEGGPAAASNGIVEPESSASTHSSPEPGDPQLAAALQKEHENAPGYCHSSFLGGYYECSCFADRLLQARQQDGAHYARAAGRYIVEPQVGAVAEDLDLRACVARDKILAYFLKTKMNGYYGMSTERKQAVITCMANRMAEQLKSDSHGQRALDNYDRQDSTDCTLEK